MKLFRKKGLTFRKKRKKLNIKKATPVFLWLLQIALVCGLAYFTVHSWGFSTNMVGEAMEGTLNSEAVVLVDRLIYKFETPKQDDLIAFLPNGNIKSHYYIRRVIAVPGDTVQIKDGLVYVNGEVYVRMSQNEKVEVAGICEEPVTLGEDEYFVMGDNPNGSEDSRHSNIGPVKFSEICGKVWFCLKPFDNFGRLN